MSDPLPDGAIRLRNVSRSFKIMHEQNRTLKETFLRRRRTVSTDLWALRNVDLDIEPGQSIGIIGQNGSGKSTLLKLIAGILYPQTGTVTAAGKVASMLELGAGFHPDFTGRENVYMNGSIHGLSEDEITARLDEIVAFSELTEFIDMPVKTYSSGMHMRLAFAVAIHVDADILLLDEVLAVGDEAFQRKCFGRIGRFRRNGGTIVLVSHDAGAIELICDRALYLADGRIEVDAQPAKALAAYHRALSDSPSQPTGSGVEVPSLGGAASGSASYGTGRASITGLRIVNDSGEETLRFLGGTGFSVEIDYDIADDTIPDPKFTVRVSNPSGEVMFGLNTIIDAVSWNVRRPKGTITMRVPQLPLFAGQFLVSAGVSAADEGELYHLVDNALEFSVFAPGRGEGVVLVEREWIHDEQDTAGVAPRAGL